MSHVIPMVFVNYGLDEMRSSSILRRLIYTILEDEDHHHLFDFDVLTGDKFHLFFTLYQQNLCSNKGFAMNMFTLEAFLQQN